MATYKTKRDVAVILAIAVLLVTLLLCVLRPRRRAKCGTKNGPRLCGGVGLPPQAGRRTRVVMCCQQCMRQLRPRVHRG